MIFHRITKEDENTTTELLANLMQRKYVRDEVIRFLLSSGDSELQEILSKKELDRITGSCISTQVRTEKHGQPDLVISSDDLFLIIENKVRVDTQLQDHEIYDYPKYAKKHAAKKKCYLVYLVPNEYRFFETIQTKCSYPGVTVKTCIWDQLITHLESLEIESPLFCDSIAFLRKYFPQTKKSRFTAEEVFFMFKPDYYFAYLEFQIKFSERIKEIVNSVLKELNSRSIGKFSYSHSQNDEGGFGEYITYGKNGSIFIGLSNPKDFEDKKYVYSVCFWTQVFNCEYLYGYPEVKDNKYGWKCVPFFDDNFTEKDFIDPKNEDKLSLKIADIITDACKSVLLSEEK